MKEWRLIDRARDNRVCHVWYQDNEPIREERAAFGNPDEQMPDRSRRFRIDQRDLSRAEEAMVQRIRRAEKYPQLNEMADALFHYFESNDRTQLDEWIAQCRQVRDNLPLPPGEPERERSEQTEIDSAQSESQTEPESPQPVQLAATAARVQVGQSDKSAPQEKDNTIWFYLLMVAGLLCVAIWKITST